MTYSIADTAQVEALSPEAARPADALGGEVEAALDQVICRLWQAGPEHPLRALLPGSVDDLRRGQERLARFVDRQERRLLGRIDPAAVIRGEVVAMGPGSELEAGAIVHESCRLVLGEGSRVGAGAVLRGEVVVGDHCRIGANCEVARSLILGPGTIVSHFVFLADSVLGSDVTLSGYVAVANSSIRKGATIKLRSGGRRLDTGRTHLGLLAGDGARLGACVTVCPGAIVAGGLSVPPRAVLLGTIDAARNERLVSEFYARWEDPADAPAASVLSR